LAVIDMQTNAFNNLPQDAEVESRARAIFRAACEGSDSYHVLRLGLARRKALHAQRTSAVHRTWMPLAGGAIACCALALGVVLLHPGMHARPMRTPASSAPISVAPVADDTTEVGGNQMDLVQNLDFYSWLASQSGTSAQHATRSTP
jgi:hypothetical protein